MTVSPPEEPDALDPAGPGADPARTASARAEAVLASAEAVVEPLAAQLDLAALDTPRRLLLVHAHPDDETIGTGATMAHYAANRGTLVTLVTCTLGEEGEVVVDDLAHLAADRDDTLGQHRIGELAAACEALGVRDHRFLGGPGRWRDSGMMGTPANERPDCFWRADPDEATGELVAILREVRPQVVVTYDPNGGYGHPDHIQAHRITVAAVTAAASQSYRPDLGEPWQADKLYWAAIPKSVLQAGIDALAETGSQFFEGVTSADDLPFGVPDDEITSAIDARDAFDAKVAALRAHRTQVAVNGPFFALADGIGQRAWGVEHFTLAQGVRGPGEGEHGWESDLFAGLPPA